MQGLFRLCGPRIATWNQQAIFPATAAAPAWAIKSDFKIDVKVLLRHLKDMGKLVKAIPASWVNDKTTKCDIMFLTQEADKKSILKRLPSNSAIEPRRLRRMIQFCSSKMDQTRNAICNLL